METRISELAERSYKNSIFTFTNFLTLQELSDFYDLEKELSYAAPFVFGGADICERKMVRFGDPEVLGYDEAFPIDLLLIEPLSQKWADDLTHRDFLGALMNLGINRDMLGDIFTEGKKAFLFCRESMTAYICENLTSVKHTQVSVRKLEDVTDLPAPKLSEQVIQVMNPRIDAVVSRAYSLSRNAALELFTSKLVFINGRLCTENAKLLKAGDIVSVRGKGRFRFAEELGNSRKGKLNCRIELYI